MRLSWTRSRGTNCWASTATAILLRSAPPPRRVRLRGNKRAVTTRIATMEKSGGRPLAGVRILDFSHVLAGPMCTRLLVDLGAEVLRIESTKRFDTPWRSASDPELKRMYAYI